MHILPVITKMILILKTTHYGPSNAKHNPSQLLRLLSKEVCFISHGDQHLPNSFPLIPRSLIMEKVAVRSSLRSPNNKSALIESRANESQDKVKAKDQDIKVKLRDIKSKIKIQDHKHAKGTSKEFPSIQGSKIQDVTSREAISSITTP
ncbi:hypothetical protein Tco_1377672 [Tanacetum coccineum]